METYDIIYRVYFNDGTRWEWLLKSSGRSSNKSFWDEAELWARGVANDTNNWITHLIKDERWEPNIPENMKYECIDSAPGYFDADNDSPESFDVNAVYVLKDHEVKDEVIIDYQKASNTLKRFDDQFVRFILRKQPLNIGK